MLKKNRTPSSTTWPQNSVASVPVSWRRLVSVALFTGVLRHIGALLASLVVTWWQQD